jgi:hypothetical protein
LRREKREGKNMKGHNASEEKLMIILRDLE